MLLACPWRPPTLWLMSAIMPEKAGATNEVPPSVFASTVVAFEKSQPCPVPESHNIRECPQVRPDEANMEISGRARALPEGNPVTPLCQSGRVETVLNPPLPAERVNVGEIPNNGLTGS